MSYCTLLCIYWFSSKSTGNCYYKSNERAIAALTAEVQFQIGDDYWYGASTKCRRALPKREMESILFVLSDPALL
jgi:hypothetical protein